LISVGLLVSRIQDEQERRHSPKLFTAGNSYWLTRFVILRLLGLVYAVAFLVAAKQLVPLIGENGLTPATHFLNLVQNATGLAKRRHVASADAFFGSGISDDALSIFSWAGLRYRFVVLGGYATRSCWRSFGRLHVDRSHSPDLVWLRLGNPATRDGVLIDFSLSTTRWPTLSQVQATDPGDWRCAVAAVSASCLGAGLIKICAATPVGAIWTCLYYHYETQPIPNPISRYLHFCPAGFHSLKCFGITSSSYRTLVLFRPANGRGTIAWLLITFQIFSSSAVIFPFSIISRSFVLACFLMTVSWRFSAADQS